MELRINRKGLLFTFMAILIAGLLTTVYSTHQITPIDEDVSVEKARILSSNQRFKSVVTYAETSLQIAGYRSLQEMIDYIHEEDTFYTKDELNIIFSETIRNGTINGVERKNMRNLTVNELMDDIVDLVMNESRAIIQYNITSITIDQIKPFAVTAKMNITIVFIENQVGWNDSKEISSHITIEGLKDPLYFSIGYNNSFKKSPTNYRKFNTTTFEKLVNNSEYLSSQSQISIEDVGLFKPISFFGRLTNNSNVKNDTSLTLLSVVNPERLTSPPTSVSYIDYMFHRDFNTTECQRYLRQVNNTVNKPPVDIEHLTLVFNITTRNQEPAIC
ncbi:MAG: hypothetical protein ABIB43_00675 [archaeon]